jgi:hypothetical protein
MNRCRSSGLSTLTKTTSCPRIRWGRPPQERRGAVERIEFFRDRQEWDLYRGCFANRNGEI